MKRSGPLKRKTRLRPVSAKRAVINKARGVFVREQLARRPHCEVARLFDEALGGVVVAQPHEVALVALQLARLCTGESTELHEPLTRARAPGAETILDPANSVAICRGCHMWIHANPRLATMFGLLRSAHP